MREEAKQSEGDPHMKAQRRSRAEAIATNRMLLDVPKADVVIVNPTHYAVALKWSRTRGSAPVCVAKGEDELALRIREIAATARMPVHADPPTARALHATVAIGREIAPEHYRAVAAAIRFADRMRKAARAPGPLVTPAALRQLMTLVEARKARDLAALDRLLAEDRRLAAEIAELRRTAARDAEAGDALPPERQALRLVWADQRIRAARASAGARSPRRSARRAPPPPQSLGKLKSLETLADRADRAVAHARDARAEREAPPPAGASERVSSTRAAARSAGRASAPASRPDRPSSRRRR